ncbi:hypothetical protein G5V58_01860 [Nocardioides anomalus]|uniref:Ig-like domain repeat protein n=1 Tax=Nocardioides anomalus TaxID=2712223 RepID=A0A6G6W8Y7_9ACTN|nr:hypothetical protein [Nocardioides anomalus]QIG41682.1 hypothetical protein G5V58_01860 [Nocardioides anomalus]
MSAPVRHVLRAVLTAGAVLLGLLAAPPAAHAGQVGVTIGVQGAGAVRIVEGTVEDGGATTCSFLDNTDHRVLNWCPRVRDSEAFEAWVWLEAAPVAHPVGEWVFDHWEGCDETRGRNGRIQCGVHSDAFSSRETRPVAVFRDIRPPTLSAPAVIASATTPGAVTVTFEVAGGNARCRFDAAAYTPCSSPVTARLAVGDHRFSAYAEDASGNTTDERWDVFSVVDTTITSGPPALTSSPDAEFGFAALAGSSFLCSTGGGPWSACGQGATGTHRLTGLADGSHTFSVQATKGRWTDPQPASWSWVVDTVAPEARIASADTSGTAARFALDVPSDATLVECRLTGPGGVADWSPCRSPVRFDDLPAGRYVLEVRAHDAAGNVQATPARREWTVAGSPGGTTGGTTAPETTLTGGPAAGSWSLDRAPVFTVGASGGATCACTLDGVARPCAAGALRLDGLTAGTHVLAVAATDGSGHRDATPATRTWTVPRSAVELGRARGWALRTSASAYAGSVLQARRRHATLTVPVVGARRLALVAAGGRRHGTVKVYAGSRLLATVRLANRRSTTQRVVELPELAAAYTGDVRVVVATRGRLVRIEGLGVATS